MNYSKYIFPIISNDKDGFGVLVGNLFITAGHVLEESKKPYVKINGKSYPLYKENALIFDTNPDKKTNGYDVAVFQLNGVNSPLKLSINLPSFGKELLSCCYSHKVNTSSKIFCYKESWVREERVGKVTSLYDNYFECQFEDSLSRGSSGSPIMDGEEVVGILYGDKEGKNSSKTILFLSSTAILHYLNEANNNE